MQMRDPNFFIIGAPKCGTTALSEYLRINPRIFMSFPKEPNHFCTDMARRVGVVKWKDYQNLFADANNSHQAVGESSVHYLRSQVAIPKLLDKYPDAKFIVMVRNPVTFLRSWHNQLIYSLSETEQDFATAWNLQENRRQGRDLPPNCTDAYILDYKTAALFGEQAHRLLQYVARDRVLFLKFEDFITDIRTTYLRVLEFLGVDDDGQIEFAQYNAAHQARSRILNSVMRSLYAKLSRISPFPSKNPAHKIARNLFTKIRAANRSYQRPPPVPQDIAEQILAAVAGDQALLTQLTGLDLDDYRADKTPTDALMAI